MKHKRLPLKKAATLFAGDACPHPIATSGQFGRAHL